MTDEEGNELPFTKENVVALLLKLGDLFIDIQAMASKAVGYLKEQAETDTKD